jgi:hypothetical protein
MKSAWKSIYFYIKKMIEWGELPIDLLLERAMRKP